MPETRGTYITAVTPLWEVKPMISPEAARSARHALNRDAVIEAALTWLKKYDAIDDNGNEAAFQEYMDAEKALAAAARAVAPFVALEGIDEPDRLP